MERPHRLPRRLPIRQALLFGVLSSAAIAVLGATSARADVSLTLLHAQEGALEIPVSAGGEASLVFLLADGEAASFDVDLGSFRSTDLQYATVGVLGPESPTPTRSIRLEFAKEDRRREIRLQAKDLVPGVSYVGPLSVSGDEGTLDQWELTLVQPMPTAALVADLSRVELETEILAPYAGSDARHFTVTLHEKSGKLPVRGVRIMRAPGSVQEGDFDIARDLEFTWNGSPVADLTSWSPAANGDSRDIPVGQQARIGVTVKSLPRGEHKLTLAIGAANLDPDSAPKVELAVKVRHAMWLPSVALFGAIAASFLITQGMVNWRERIRLRALARALDQNWLGRVRELPPVVWVKSIRRQALTVLERFILLREPDDVASRLESAARVLRVVKRFTEVQDAVEQSGAPYMLRFRMRNRLDEIVRGIDPNQIDEASEKTRIAELDRLDEAIETPAPMYRPYVLTAQKRTGAMHVLGALDRWKPGIDHKSRKKLEGLWNDFVLKEVAENATRDQLVAADRVCAAMRVLKRHVEFEDDAELEDLIPLVAQDDPESIAIEEVFGISNQTVFEKIKSAAAAGEIAIAPSEKRPSATPRRALEPTRFELALDDAVLDDTFMAKKGMTANWHFELKPSGKDKAAIPWDTRSTGKRLLQFAPTKGTLQMSVTLSHEDAQSKPIEGSIDFQSPPRGLGSQAFALQQMVLVLIAGVIAFFSGLVMFYETNPSFGSIQNYLALLTWGVGVDQGKNLAQTFQGLSSSTRQASGD